MAGTAGEDCWKCLFFHECKVRESFSAQKIKCERFQPVPYYYGSPVLSAERWRELGLLRDLPDD